MSRHNEAEWAEAKRLCRLNQNTIAMARALGMGPRSLIKNRATGQQLWKAPVQDWVEDLYRRRFGDTTPAALAETQRQRSLQTPSKPPLPLLEQALLQDLALLTAEELAGVPAVVRVVLFGPLARPELDPSRKFDKVWLAVWVQTTEGLEQLSLARSRAIQRLAACELMGPKVVDIRLVRPCAGKSLRVLNLDHPLRKAIELRKLGYAAGANRVLFERTP